MRLYLDIDTREFLQSPSFPRALTTLSLKRRDTDLIELQFVRDRIIQELPTGTTIRLGLKLNAAYTAAFLTTGIFAKSGSGTATTYLLDLSLNTQEVNSAFASDEPTTLETMLEIEWAISGNIFSSLTLPTTIHNDVIRGDEGEPVEAPVFYVSTTEDFRATQGEAEIGTDNTKWMSPLRTAQAIAALSPTGVSSWNDLTDKPSTFPPETHTHAISQVTNLQAALDSKIGNTNPTINGQLTVTDGDPLIIQGHRVTSAFGSFIDFEEARFHYNGRDILNWGDGSNYLKFSPGLIIDDGDSLELYSNYIASNFGPTRLDFEEGRLEHSSSDVLFWGVLGQLNVGNRTLKELGAPVDNNDAVRKTDLDTKVTNGGGIARIERVTSMPASPAADTLYIVIP